MGVGGVGKSAITNRFVRGRWIAKYDPTIEESYQKTCEVDGNVLQVEILDTAGQDIYSSLRETFLHTGDGFLLVYSITDDQTLEDLREIREQIKNAHSDPNVPLIVVANKVDMAATHRAVSTAEGQQIAKDFGAGFLEVSAKDNTNINTAFQTLLKSVVNKDEPSKMIRHASVFGDGLQDNSGEAYDYNTNPVETNSSPKKKKKGLFSFCSLL